MAAESQSLGERLNLQDLVTGLAGDLRQLREGKISVREARARAELARQILRAIHYVVVAQKFLEQNMPPAIGAQGAGDDS